MLYRRIAQFIQSAARIAWHMAADAARYLFDSHSADRYEAQR